MLATISMLFITYETVKLVFIDEYKKYCSSILKSRSDKNRIFPILEKLYVVFLVTLLFTEFWTVGLLLFILSALIPKDDEIGYSGIAIDSVLSILLLSIIVIM